MAKAQFQGLFNSGKYKISFSLSIYIWEESNIHYAYSPALDITGYGSTEIEARNSFEVTLGEFMSYTNNKKTIYDELEHLGWTVNRRKRRVHAPNTDELIDDNESFKEILGKGGVRRESRNVELAVA